MCGHEFMFHARDHLAAAQTQVAVWHLWACVVCSMIAVPDPIWRGPTLQS